MHRDFVTEAILELLTTKRVIEVPSPTHIVNPLSVSTKGTKKRLILDLRHVNLHVFKVKIKFDDWRVMKDFVQPGGFMFQLDIK